MFLACLFESLLQHLKSCCSAGSHELYSINNLKTLESVQRRALSLMTIKVNTNKLIRSRIKCTTRQYKVAVTKTSFDGKSQNHEEDSKPT